MEGAKQMAVVVSAPGKVLMTGGYLVLERPNAGIALSTTARFYAIIRSLYEEVKPDSWAWAWTDVKLTSPQLSRESMFKLSLKNLDLQPASPSDSRNPFVEQAVQYAAAAAHATFDENRKNELHKLLLKGLDITVLGSNDFYSYRNQIEAQNLPLTPESLAALSPFASIIFNDETSDGEKGKPEVAKTGLGSSAAMTTAVVAGLLHYFGLVDLSFTSQKITKESNVSRDLDIVHIIAQSAHSIAQGKVGSGFDVSAAVYGSQRYVRFSPEVLSSAQVAVNALPLTEVILDILNGKWDHEITKFSLPPLMSLLLGEPGTGGSSTVSMVGAVKKWQKSDPQKAMETWKKLSEANKTLELQLNDLSTLAKEYWDMYKHVIHECSLHKASKWTELVKVPGEETLVRALLKARDSMLEIRCHLQTMGVAAGVPIEPEAQTELLDSTMDVEGVLLAGVPGAGGFDAVFAVTLGDATSNLAKAWSSHRVLAMLVSEDPRGISLEAGDPWTLKITSNVSSLHIQ